MKLRGLNSRSEILKWPGFIRTINGAVFGRECINRFILKQALAVFRLPVSQYPAEAIAAAAEALCFCAGGRLP